MMLMLPPIITTLLTREILVFGDLVWPFNVGQSIFISIFPSRDSKTRDVYERKLSLCLYASCMYLCLDLRLEAAI
jgi:hypothetical protein